MYSKIIDKKSRINNFLSIIIGENGLFSVFWHCVTLIDIRRGSHGIHVFFKNLIRKYTLEPNILLYMFKDLRGTINIEIYDMQICITLLALKN